MWICSHISILNHFSRTARDKSSFILLCKFWNQNHSRTKLTMFVEVTMKLIWLYKTLQWFLIMFSVQVLSIFSISSVEGKTDCSFLTAKCSFKALFTQQSLICMFYSYFQVLHQSPLLHFWRQDGQLSCQGTLRWDGKGKSDAAFLSVASLSCKILVNECKKVQIDRFLDLSPLLAPIGHSFGLLL